MDIQALFEENYISDIEAKLEEIRKNIDKEKEELRLMVSERYRDLIEAADSIVEMHERAQKICDHVERMEAGCSHIHHQGLIGFPGPDQAHLDRRARKQRVYDIGARVKLLMDMPETLWTLVETGRPLDSALLYMFAQYIFTGLQAARVELREGDVEVPVLQRFAVVGRQWTAVQRFKQTILASCDSTVRSATLQQMQLVSQCLAATSLLSGAGLRAACSHLLRQRSDAVLSTLRRSDVTDDGAVCHVLTQVTRAVHAALNTVQLVHAIFTESSPLQLTPDVTYCSRVSAALSCRPFELVADRGAVAMRHLASDVKQYIPMLCAAGESSGSEQIAALVRDWLRVLSDETRPLLSQLLEGVVSVEVLASIRDRVFSILEEDPHVHHWDAICHQLNGDSISFWELIVRDTLVQRAQNILVHSVGRAFDELNDELVRSVSDADRLRSECDIVDFRWSDFTTEVTSGDGWMNYRHRSTDCSSGVTLRLRGHTDTVQRCCSTLDGRLSDTLRDLERYTGSDTLRPGPATSQSASTGDGPFDKWADASTLRASLRDAVRLQLVSLTARLAEIAGSSVHTDAAVFVARVPRGLVDLAPRLILCLDSDSRSAKIPSASGRQLWDTLSSQLLAVRAAVMEPWIISTADSLAEQLSQALRSITVDDLTDFTQWTASAITEETESGETVQSVVRVPRTPRLSVLLVLSTLSGHINRMGSMSLGREVQSRLVCACVRRLLSVYGRFYSAVNSNTSTTADVNHAVGTTDSTDASPLHVQGQALQSLFDIHMLRNLLVTRDQELSREVSGLCDSVEEYIDPFDISVCWPQAQKNLKLFTQQTQALFGALSVDRGALKTAAVPSSPSPSSSGQQEGHNLLPMSTGPVRFTLLAVPDSTPLQRHASSAADVVSNVLPMSFSTPNLSLDMILPSTQKLAETLRPSASFLANLSGSWF